MDTRYQGTFVISWAQVEIDGLTRVPLAAVVVGATFRWSGEAVRVDGPQGRLVLTGAQGEDERRRRAARRVRQVLGAAVHGGAPEAAPAAFETPEHGFTLTDGFHAYPATVIEAPGTAARLVMFCGRMPAAGAELWVIERRVEALPETAPERQGGGPGRVICFTPGTRIDTPAGPRPVESLRAGDLVSTLDDGPQPLVWTGGRRITGARMHVYPELRPVRLRAGAFGIGRPEGDLLVSPRHRMLIEGAAARALFNCEAVLVRACDLVNGSSVRRETGLAEVRYIHLMFARHQVLRANGFETESFHPAEAALGDLPEAQRLAMADAMPEVLRAPESYGAHARRALSAGEAAILRHDLAA